MGGERELREMKGDGGWEGKRRKGVGGDLRDATREGFG